MLASCSAMSDETLIILAYPKEIRISDKSCSEFLKDSANICMDGVIELKYEVDEVISGRFDDKTISIIDFYHSNGFPKYVTEYPVYFTLRKNGDTYFLVNDAKLIDGKEEFWICGSNLDPNVSDGHADEPPYKELNSDTCKKGVELERLKKYFQ